MGKIIISEVAVERALDNPQMQAVLMRTANAIAENVRAQNIKVDDVNGGSDEIPLPVHVYPNDRGELGAVVVLSHAAGAAVQAKHGSLTTAAAQAGLDVSGGS